jgi:hypothetical protein
MPKISTYPVVAPASNDLVTVTDASDSNNTKNVTVESLSVTVYSGAYSEIYDATSGGVTPIAASGTFYPLVCATTQGATNDATLSQNSLGLVTNNGATRTFLVTYCVSCTSGNNNNIMFKLAKNGAAISYSESDTIASSNGKATSTSNSVIVTLATSDTIQVYGANANSTTSITLEHLNIIIRQL